MNDFKSQRDAKLAAKAARRPAPVAIAPKPVAPPVPKPTPAPTAAQVAALRAEIDAYRAGPAAKPFPGEHHGHIDAESYPPSPSRAIHKAAIAVIAQNPAMSYREAVETVSRKA